MTTKATEVKQGMTLAAERSLALPRAIVIELVEEHPNARIEDLFDDFQRAIDGRDDYRVAIDWYFMANMARYARDERFSAKSAARKAQATARAEAKQEAVKQTVQQIALLFLTMPNGKAMRYCTGTDMKTFGKAYERIGKRVGWKTVGEVLNEDEVRRLMVR